MRWLVALGRFWYDFIVGDSVVLAIGGVAILVAGFVLARVNASVPAQVALPLGVVGVLALSLRGSAQ